jgi:hypothetical protein
MNMLELIILIVLNLILLVLTLRTGGLLFPVIGILVNMLYIPSSYIESVEFTMNPPIPIIILVVFTIIHAMVIFQKLRW